VKANAEAHRETLLVRKCSTVWISFLLYQMMHVDLIIFSNGSWFSRNKLLNVIVLNSSIQFS